MANLPFEVLYDHVLPYLPGAEPPMVDAQIRKVVREFMTRTTLYRELFTVPLTDVTATYRLRPTQGQVSAVMQVRHPNGMVLPPVPEEHRARLMSPGQPMGWYTTVPDLITIVPAPDNAYELAVEAALTLKQDDIDFPEELFNQHAEALSAGVLSMMFGMPGKPWSQTTAAQAAGRQYAGMIRSVRGRLRDGGQPNASTFTSPRRFGC